MKPRTATEMAIMCATGLIALSGSSSGSRSRKTWMVVAVDRRLMPLRATARKRAQIELSGGEQYRQLADEYRRLADLAITAQEHTDLKLGDVSAQLDYLREQNESLQKILKEVE